MKDTCFLIFSKHGFKRATKGSPTLGRDEIAVAVKATIPDECFRSSVFTAALDVPEDRVLNPVIDMEVLPAPESTS